ncbi:pyridoxamine 5'-phosphate oxidase family protein [Acuticoccus kandeliae]|uniref:pyridoxamine 5'-phosphate oxidase family protein n=1 Tax=Acuticoccus kandeliae TaxID=2073160 RepID=UPI0013007C08|nr:pyridoxamine 5'-phosphate oxidase family protein [Acuticoccus kandeliae]
MLAAGAATRNHPFRQGTLATLSPDGLPSARTVILRGADRGARALVAYTDARSPKCEELRLNVHLTLVFYDHGAKTQLVVAGTATLHAGDEVAAAHWAGMAEASKLCYRQPVGPGILLASPDDAEEGGLLTDAAGYSHFVVISVCVHHVDWLYLAAAGNRRARIAYKPVPAASWVAP